VTDTLVFVDDEIVKRYDGDITNRNCVRCNHPRQYPDFEHYDAAKRVTNGSKKLACQRPKGTDGIVI
jgi:hypothetical protein